jgi:chemosensory pili system protein ChpA (sensor histidine kinase/response regulator)
LLVEDDFASRELLSMILAGEGYRVAAAANGVEGLQRLRGSDRPSLILLDLNMPVMDGRTFCARRHEDRDLDSIPVVVISAAGDVAEQAAALGAARYLQKPVDTVQLLDAVRQCCP